ncbi:MAG: glycosyltransferase family 4 protein [Myxococcota bacterium]|nr:glycosyltransferase family 4 protein [Myxococcota bacterium]
MKKILYCEFCNDGTAGGSHQALFDSIRLQNDREFEAVVVFYEENRFVQPLRDIGVDVHIWAELQSAERDYASSPSLFKKAFGMLRSIQTRRRFLKTQNVDLVHLNNSPHYGYDDWLPAAKSLNIPCIVNVMGGPYHLPATRIKRYWTRRFDRYICISHHVYQELESEGFPLERLSEVKLGIDLERFRKRVHRNSAEVRAELDILENQTLVAMVGNLQPWKGHDVVVSAVENLLPAERDQLCILFVGAIRDEDQHHVSSMRTRIRNADLKNTIRFLGSRGDVPDLLNAADLQLHASTFPEPFGLVLVEGLCLGTPLIAASLGGPQEILTPETGTLFDPSQPEELTRILREHLKSPDKKRAMAVLGPERARKFDAGRMAEGHAKIYREFLSTTASDRG